MFGIKSALRSALRRLGFGTWTIGSGETLNFENLLYILKRGHDRIALIHIGAHDGRSFSDPLYHFVIQNQDSVVGVYVEPVSSTYERLKKNLGHIKGLVLLRAAVHPFEKTVEIFSGTAVKKRRKWDPSGRSTVDKSRLQSTPSEILAGSIKSELVPGISVSECLSYLPINSSNLPLVICVDTEGLDFEIVRSSIRAGIFPWLIRFEHNLCLTNSPSDIDDYLSLVLDLNQVGYQVITEHNDATAIHLRLTDQITKPYK